MYNRNYGGFDYVRIHSELLNAVLNPKIIANLVRNCRLYETVTHNYEKSTADINNWFFECNDLRSRTDYV